MHQPDLPYTWNTLDDEIPTFRTLPHDDQLYLCKQLLNGATIDILRARALAWQPLPHSSNPTGRCTSISRHRGTPMTPVDLHQLRPGDTIYHREATNADGSLLRARVTGKLRTWKRDPNRFELPVKYGLRTSFLITPDNIHEWQRIQP